MERDGYAELRRISNAIAELGGISVKIGVAALLESQCDGKFTLREALRAERREDAVGRKGLHALEIKRMCRTNEDEEGEKGE
jgi:hypothetical protein